MNKKNTLTRFNTLALLVSSLAILAGCSSTPNPIEQVEGEAIEDALERKRLSVIFSEVQPSHKRLDIYTEYASDPELVNSIKLRKENSGIDDVVAANVLGDAVAGSLGSNLGTNLAVGTMALQAATKIFSGPRIIQKAYVPTTLNGHEINTREEGKLFIYNQINQSIQDFSDNYGISYTCVSDKCDEHSGVLEFDLRNILGKGYVDTEKVYVNYVHDYLLKERKNRVRDIALGYQVKFGHQNFTHSLSIKAWVDVELDDSGNIKLYRGKTVNGLEYQFVASIDLVENSRNELLKQFVLSGFFGNPYMSMSIDDANYSERLFYNGKVYNFETYRTAEIGFVHQEVNLEYALFNKIEVN